MQANMTVSLGAQQDSLASHVSVSVSSSLGATRRESRAISVKSHQRAHACMHRFLSGVVAIVI